MNRYEIQKMAEQVGLVGLDSEELDRTLETYARNRSKCGSSTKATEG